MDFSAVLKTSHIKLPLTFPHLDNDDEFSAKKDTVQINYASSDYLPSYSATIPQKDPSAMMPIFIHESV